MMNHRTTLLVFSLLIGLDVLVSTCANDIELAASDPNQGDGLSTTDGFDFAISAAPPNRTIFPGGSTYFMIFVDLIGGAPKEVFVGCTRLFAGASTSFTPHYLVPSGLSVLELHTLPSVPIGKYRITLQASRGVLARSISLEVIVTKEPFDFTISTTPETQSIRQGESIDYSIAVSTISGGSKPVQLDVVGLPFGCMASFNPKSITPGERSTLTITTSQMVDTGTYSLTVMGTSAGVSRMDTVKLVVTASEPATRN